jgi:hypothetical protein
MIEKGDPSVDFEKYQERKSRREAELGASKPLDIEQVRGGFLESLSTEELGDLDRELNAVGENLEILQRVLKNHENPSEFVVLIDEWKKTYVEDQKLKLYGGG